MYPPALAWFPDNGVMPHGFQDNLEKISWLNSQIQQLNVKNLAPDYPRFHTYGVRTNTRSRMDMFGYEHENLFYFGNTGLPRPHPLIFVMLCSMYQLLSCFTVVDLKP